MLVVSRFSIRRKIVVFAHFVVDHVREIWHSMKIRMLRTIHRVDIFFIAVVRIGQTTPNRQPFVFAFCLQGVDKSIGFSILPRTQHTRQQQHHHPQPHAHAHHMNRHIARSMYRCHGQVPPCLHRNSNKASIDDDDDDDDDLIQIGLVFDEELFVIVAGTKSIP